MTLEQFINNTDYLRYVKRHQNEWHIRVSVTPTEARYDFVKDGEKDVYPAAVVQLHGREEVLKAIAVAKEVMSND